MNKNNEVLVALSGGIDSAYTAYILKNQGWKIITATMELFDEPCGTSTKEYAGNLAAFLDTEHYDLNYSKDFEDVIVSDFISEYIKGNTPNPCVLCNKFFKFDRLWEFAQSHGCSHIATGHYACIRESNGEFGLYRGKDFSKEQSYFLYAINPALLSHILMPLGELTKDYIRSQVSELKLPVKQQESKEACFIGNQDYRAFLQTRIPEYFIKGDIILTDGTILGTHNGVINYTIGQRKGLGIGYSEPLYVIRIDAQNNRVIVGTRDELSTDEFTISRLSVMNKRMLIDGISLKVKVRYQAPMLDCTIQKRNSDKVFVKLKNPFPDITPGQSAVFYHEDQVVFGGLII